MKKLFAIGLMVAGSTLLGATAAAQVRPFVQAGIGNSQFWLMNAEGTKGRFAYYGGVGVELPVKRTPSATLRPPSPSVCICKCCIKLQGNDRKQYVNKDETMSP